MPLDNYVRKYHLIHNPTGYLFASKLMHSIDAHQYNRMKLMDMLDLEWWLDEDYDLLISPKSTIDTDLNLHCPDPDSYRDI